MLPPQAHTSRQLALAAPAGTQQHVAGSEAQELRLQPATPVCDVGIPSKHPESHAKRLPLAAHIQLDGTWQRLVVSFAVREVHESRLHISQAREHHAVMLTVFPLHRERIFPNTGATLRSLGAACPRSNKAASEPSHKSPVHLELSTPHSSFP